MKKRIAFALLALCHSPAYANNINATSNPVANSSGSVTNFAVQNLPSRQFTNLFGDGIVCQGDTLAIQPFVSSNMSFTRPDEQTYLSPIYDESDFTGHTTINDEGEEVDGPDGNPDNPGAVIGYKTIRTGQKENFSISPGISLSWNIQLDRQSIRLCKEAASKRISLLQAAYEDKRLSYELGRLKLCAKLLKDGVRYRPGTKYAMLCEDVELVNPPGVLPNHSHTISYPGNATSDQ